MSFAEIILWVCAAIGFAFLWAMLIRASVRGGGCGSISCRPGMPEDDEHNGD